MCACDLPNLISCFHLGPARSRRRDLQDGSARLLQGPRARRHPSRAAYSAHVRVPRAAATQLRLLPDASGRRGRRQAQELSLSATSAVAAVT